MSRRRFARCVLAVLATSAIFGCLSPTIPLPPPALPSVMQGDEEGTVRLSSNGGAHANAILVIYNRNPDVPLDRRVSGSQADATGSWDAKVYATSGDLLDLTQQFGNQTSPSVTFQVPTPVPSFAGDAGVGAASTPDASAD